jgi:DMSO/TMAO reductase YedYZ molybdopterin-dependent catalytic subunit
MSNPSPIAPPGRAAIGGLIAAAVALAMTELIGSIGNPASPTIISAVGSRFIDRAAGSLKDFAVRVFGTNDKPALLTGIVAICLILGALLGLANRRNRLYGIVGFVIFGIIGLFAGLADPQAEGLRIAVSAIGAVFAGIAVLEVLVRRDGALIARRPAPVTAPADPAVHGGDRRSFLRAAGSASAFAVVAATGANSLRGASPAATSRAATTLPLPKRRAKVPTDKFAVTDLSPYVTPLDSFYRIDTALTVPQINASTWKMTIKGMVDREVSFTYADLLAMDLVEEVVTISCVSNEVGGGLVGNAVWTGVPLTTLLDRAGVRSGATQIVGRSVDDFTVGFPTEKVRDGRTALVAIGMNGEPLPVAHGFPARLVVSGLYGYVSATKWLKEIELTRLEDYDAYWINRGWSKDGPIKTQSRIDTPKSGAQLPFGKVAVAGVAWAPSRGISKVDVQIDNGEWVPAQLGDATSNNTWVQWLYPWDATRGTHTITVRATDATGAVQTAERADPAPSGATGLHSRRVVIA